MIKMNLSRSLFLLSLLFVAIVALALRPSSLQATTIPDPVPVENPADCYEANIFYGQVPPDSQNSEVLVFIHGYNGKALDWWYFNFSTGLNDMYIQAYNAGYRTAFLDVNVLPTNPTCETSRQPVNSMMDAGEVIKHQLDYITDYYNVPQVTIIAHSKGGVDAQSAIIFHEAGDKVRNVFTLSSPHQGELLADFIWGPAGALYEDIITVVGKDEGTRSLRIANMGPFRLYADEQPVNDSINYFTSGGTGWEGSGGVTQIAGAILQNLGYDNDGIVTVGSTHLNPYGVEFFVKEWDHAEMYQGYNSFPLINAILTSPPSEVIVTGTNSGYMNSDYTFIANTNPITVTRPLTYTWSATGQPTVVNAGEDLEDQATFRWNSTGTKTVTVVVDHRWGSVSQSFDIVILSSSTNVSPTAVELSGEMYAKVDTPTQLIANLTPANTSQLVTYEWEVTDLGTITHFGGANDTIDLEWSTPGSKQVTVTATNNFGSVSNSFTVEVGIPPTSITLQGPSVGEHRTLIGFEADVLPLDVTGPITYTWRAVDYDQVIRSGGVTDQMIYEWEYSAPQNVAVMAETPWGKVVDYLAIQIVNSPEDVNIEAPLVGVVNTTYDFIAAVTPISATVPFTYTWKGGSTPIVNVDGIENRIALAWEDAGTNNIGVVVENVETFAPPVFDVHTITILEDVPNTAPANLTLDAPIDGLINTEYRFTAHLTPITATQPVNYEWEVDGHPTIVQENGANDTLMVSWDTDGTYEVTVTATNTHGSTSVSTFVAIYAPVLGLTLEGPEYGEPSTEYAFTAITDPPFATSPITYTWFTATAGDFVEVGGATSTKVYSWTLGSQVVGVTAENEWGAFTTSALVEIVSPMSTVVINGIEEGQLGLTYEFVANVLPSTVGVPIQYAWSATDQLDIVNEGDISNAVSYRWTTGGTKTITVVATDSLGESVTRSLTVDIYSFAYLPALIQSTTTLQQPTNNLHLPEKQSQIPKANNFNWLTIVPAVLSPMLAINFLSIKPTKPKKKLS